MGVLPVLGWALKGFDEITFSLIWDNKQCISIWLLLMMHWCCNIIHSIKGQEHVFVPNLRVWSFQVKMVKCFVIKTTTKQNTVPDGHNWYYAHNYTNIFMTGTQMSLKLHIPVVLFSAIFFCAHTKHAQTCCPETDLNKNMSCVLLRSSFPVAVYNRKSSRNHQTMDDQQQHWDIYCGSIKVWMWMSVCYSFSVRDGEKRGGRSSLLLHSISHHVLNLFVLFHLRAALLRDLSLRDCLNEVLENPPCLHAITV